MNSWRTLLAVGYDLIASLLAWTASIAIAQRSVPALDGVTPFVSALIIVMMVQMACFAAFRLYRGIWRYASFLDLRRIGVAVLMATLVQTTLIFLIQRGEMVPRLALLLNPVILVVMMAGGRIIYRWWKELRPYAGLRHEGEPVLVMGAGEAGYKVVFELSRSPAWAVCGLLDDEPAKLGRELYGSRVLGSWEQLASVAASTGARHALIAVGSHNRHARRRAFDLCEQAGVRLLVVPAIEELMAGEPVSTSIRNIDLDDLLGRDPVRLDAPGLSRMLTQRCVLVTGAGGSIGADLCRQIARFSPARLVLLDSSEFALYEAEESLAYRFPGIVLNACVGDVKDSQRLDELFARLRPDIVFHAAAYKHVPIMEGENAWQAVRNNVWGSLQVIEASRRHSVRKLVIVSTDKAVNPTNVMGATKRLAELLAQRHAETEGTSIVTVRFGNVLGSTGSVIPKFKAQIARGGPITVTHPEVERYFMSVSEATQLVLQAAAMGDGGEVFVLEMGKAVKIVDLARDLIRLSGLTEQQIPIRFVGLRPGEKLFEELLANGETTLPTRHPKVRISRPTELPDADWERALRQWLAQPGAVDPATVRATLARFVPEYSPFRATPADASSGTVIALKHVAGKRA